MPRQGQRSLPLVPWLHILLNYLYHYVTGAFLGEVGLEIRIRCTVSHLVRKHAACWGVTSSIPAQEKEFRKLTLKSLCLANSTADHAERHVVPSL